MPKENNKIDWEEILNKFSSYKGSIIKDEALKVNKDELSWLLKGYEMRTTSNYNLSRLNYHENYSIKQIKSFVNGVRKDYRSVKNYVIYIYNNSILEGYVNRLKMIKRTM